MDSIDSKILFSELVSSKLLHDISGFISTVINTAACLNLADIKQNDLDSLNFYSDALLNSVRVMRQAYAMSDENHSMHKTLENLEIYFGHKGFELNWDIKFDSVDGVSAFIKVMVNVLLYFGSRISKISSVDVIATKSETDISMSANIFAPIVREVSFNDTDNVKPEDFQHNFIVNLLKAYNVMYSCSVSEISDQLSISLRMKQ